MQYFKSEKYNIACIHMYSHQAHTSILPCTLGQGSGDLLFPREVEAGGKVKDCMYSSVPAQYIQHIHELQVHSLFPLRSNSVQRVCLQHVSACIRSMV